MNDDASLYKEMMDPINNQIDWPRVANVRIFYQTFYQIEMWCINYGFKNLKKNFVV